MKTFVIFFLLFFNYYLIGQKSLVFEKKQQYLGELSINNTVTVEFNFTNQSDKEVLLSYEPITNLVNANFSKTIIAPKEKGMVKVNFFPEIEGDFNEKLKIKVNGKDETELVIYGLVVTITASFKNQFEDPKLYGDKEIAFMIIDGMTNKGIPHSKIFIRNIENNKSYIGISDDLGVLTNRIPEGKYKVQAIIDGYKQDCIDIKLDPNRNLAKVILEKTEIQDTVIVIPKKIVATTRETIDSKKLDTSSNIQMGVISNPKTSEPIVIQQIDEVKYTDSKLSVSNTRTALNIILLLDVSKSMGNQNRMILLKKSLTYLIQNYESNDKLTILTFNDKVNILYDRNQIKDKSAIINILNSIEPSGTTDGVLGIDRAFEILQSNYMQDAVNMVIIASDGKISNQGYDDKKLYEKIESMNESGLLTSVLGFGNSNYEKSKLNKMASIGGGLFLDYSQNVKLSETLLFDEIYSTMMKLK